MTPECMDLLCNLLVERKLKVALYKGKPPAKYTTKGEVKGLGYYAGGQPLVTSAHDCGVYILADAVWEDSTLVADSALVYEDKGGCAVLSFGFSETQTSERDEFRVGFDPSKPLISFKE